MAQPLRGSQRPLPYKLNVGDALEGRISSQELEIEVSRGRVAPRINVRAIALPFSHLATKLAGSECCLGGYVDEQLEDSHGLFPGLGFWKSPEKR